MIFVETNAAAGNLGGLRPSSTVPFPRDHDFVDRDILKEVKSKCLPSSRVALVGLGGVGYVTMLDVVFTLALTDTSKANRSSSSSTPTVYGKSRPTLGFSGSTQGAPREWKRVTVPSLKGFIYRARTLHRRIQKP